MQNALKSPQVFHSLSKVQRSKASSETQGNLLIVTPCKVKRQIIDLYHTVAKNLHYHFKMEERGHSEGLWNQNQTETQEGKLQTL